MIVLLLAQRVHAQKANSKPLLIYAYYLVNTDNYRSFSIFGDPARVVNWNQIGSHTTENTYEVKWTKEVPDLVTVRKLIYQVSRSKTRDLADVSVYDNERVNYYAHYNMTNLVLKTVCDSKVKKHNPGNAARYLIAFLDSNVINR